MEIKFLGNYRNQNQGFCGSVYSRGGVLSWTPSKGLQRTCIDTRGCRWTEKIKSK